MIRYALACPKDHRFDSWFQNADALDRLAAGGHLACPVCGSADVRKVPMAPAVRSSDRAAAPPAAGTARPGTAPGTGTAPGAGPPVPAGPRPSLGTPASALEEAFAALRREIEAKSDYVGMNFPAEARAMHLGEVPERPIHGEAAPDEARKLIEDGIPVAPLPFLPRRRAN
jgi:hypothetical protein